MKTSCSQDSSTWNYFNSAARCWVASIVLLAFAQFSWAFAVPDSIQKHPYFDSTSPRVWSSGLMATEGPSGTINLSASLIMNSTVMDSGNIRLEWWAFPTNFMASASSLSGYRLAAYSVGTLSPDEKFENVSSGPIAYSPPPDGIWYFTLLATELRGSNYFWIGYQSSGLAYSCTEGVCTETSLAAILNPCGLAINTISPGPPTSNLCTAGFTPSPPSDQNYWWTWSCFSYGLGSSTLDQQSCSANKAEPCAHIAVHRYRNTQILGHFYTTDTAEGNALIRSGAPLEYEGIAFVGCAWGHTPQGDPHPQIFPVYRFKSLTTPGVYFYSMLPEEIESVRTNLSHLLQEEGIAYYAFNSPNYVPEIPSPLRFPVHRFRNANVPGANFYTADANERDTINRDVPGYPIEGIGFYAMRHTISPSCGPAHGTGIGFPDRAKLCAIGTAVSIEEVPESEGRTHWACSGENGTQLACTTVAEPPGWTSLLPGN